MYELKRKEVIKEQLKLGEEVLDIVIIPEDIAREYNAAVAEFMKARNAVRGAQGEAEAKAAIEQYGKALTAITGLLLGNENTEKIVTFYEGRVMEMGVHITPYLVNVLLPLIKKAAIDMQQRTRETYRKAGLKSRLFKR
jgi:hypothetical protein